MLYPDTLVGTDSHTTMINGLGVLGWGVGGIEAEAAMLGQPMSMLIPQVVGFKLTGELPEGATATDLVLTVTQMLREHGVVGKFVEFYGPGIPNLPLADRATIGNMCPEFGSTCAIFPIDAETLRYLEFTGRSKERIELVEAYARAQGLWHDEDSEEPTYSETLELDLGDVVPSLAGPKRPQDRVSLTESKAAFRARARGHPARRRARARRAPRHDVDEAVDESFPASDAPGHNAGGVGTRRAGAAAEAGARVQVAERVEHAVRGHARGRHRDRARPRPRRDRRDHEVHEHVEPVGDARRRACWRGTPSSAGCKVQAVGEDVARARLEGRHRVLRARRPDRVARAARLPPRRLRLHDVHRQLRPAAEGDLRRRPGRGLAVVCVLSGNRNFEGRINPDVKMNYLASPPLVVAYALAGRWTSTCSTSRSAQDSDGEDVYLQGHLAQRPRRSRAWSRTSVHAEMFQSTYGEVFDGDERWNSLEVPEGDRFAWAADSTYVRRPPFFEDLPREPRGLEDIEGARVLAMLGDSVTTDHISPAGSIKEGSPAGAYLKRARRRAEGLQLLRLAPRQPRGDDARHVRQHPPAQPAGGWPGPASRGRRDAPPAATASRCRSTTPR